MHLVAAVLAWAGTWASVERRADAADTSEPVAIAYDASPGCPTRAFFLASLRQRTTLWRAALPAEAARTFDVRLATGVPSRGELHVRDVDGQEAIRTVTAATCAELMEAMALSVAIAIDPRAAAPLGAIVPSQPTTAAPAPPPAPPLPPPPPPPPSPAPAPPRAAPTPQPRAAPFATRAAVRRLAVSNGLRVDGVAAVAPVVMLGAGLWTDVEAPELWPGWTPAVRVGLERDTGSQQTQAAGTVAFADTLVTVDLCARAWRQGRWSFRGCLHADAGVQSPHADDQPAAPHPKPFWFDAGAGVMLRVGLFAPFFAEIDLRFGPNDAGTLHLRAVHRGLRHARGDGRPGSVAGPRAAVIDPGGFGHW